MTCAIHTKIAKSQDPYATDYAAMGLGDYKPGQNAFTACAERTSGGFTPPAKRGPKPKPPSKAAVDPTTTFAERQAAREKAVLKSTGRSFCTPIAGAKDDEKTAKIKGKSNSRRSS